jgi:serine/threonine protein kinase
MTPREPNGNRVENRSVTEPPRLHLLAGESGTRDETVRHRPFLRPGDRVGPYRIVVLIGVGGWGEVYKAVDTRLQRVVALKILPRRPEDPHLCTRFEREARAIGRVLHPRICVLHDIGSEGAFEYLVMEFLDGVTLAERLTAGALEITHTLDYALNIVEGLAEIHRYGIVHRDIKPGNIMLTADGAKLLDFGIATEQLADPATTDDITRGERPMAFTTAWGTPRYMAPEQLWGTTVDQRTDIFAFGAVLYEMITGTKAFAGDTALDVTMAVLEDDPAPISTDASPQLEALDYVVRRCVAKDPSARWQSSDALEIALQQMWILSWDDRPGENALARCLRNRRG